jgi:hypothetical protein
LCFLIQHIARLPNVSTHFKMTRQLSFSLTIFLASTALTVFGQTTNNIPKLDSIYQSILDNDKFVNEILKDTSFLCNGTLLLLSNSNDTAFNSKLTFRGRQLIIPDTIVKCPTLSFLLSRSCKDCDSYKLSVMIHKVIGQSGSCTFYNTKYYSCILNKSGDKYETKKIEIGSGQSSAKFMR